MRIPAYRPEMGEAEIAAIRETVADGWVSQKGPVVEGFEQDLAAFLDVSHVLVTDSGTASLHLALAAHGIGPGDEVIVPDFTYGATATAVMAVGATPVLVDIEADTCALEPGAVKEALTDATAAILVVHMFGRPAPLDALQDIAADHDIPLIEDAAQAFGASRDGDHVGTIGDVGCFSFSWSKMLTTGKGGAVATDDAAVAERIRELADYGRAGGSRFEFVRPGYNARMDSIRAAVGRVQLDRFETTVQEKRDVFSLYDDRLAPLPVDTTMRDVPEGITVAPCIYVARTADRDALHDHLTDRGIGSRTIYRPLHTLPAFSTAGRYPEATAVSDTVIGLPSHPGMTAQEVADVCDAIATFYGEETRESAAT